MSPDPLRPYSKQSRRRNIWFFASLVVILIIGVAIVVPSGIVTTIDKANNRGSTGKAARRLAPRDQIPCQKPPLPGSPSYAYPLSVYANLTRVRTIQEFSGKERIFVIGDVHGCIDEFNQLVDEIQYNPKKDQIILAGDLIYRGPDNVGVIRRAKELNATCVRGNHDDIVVRIKGYQLHNGPASLDQPKKNVIPEGNVTEPILFGDDHVEIAKNMTRDDYDYLAACPLVLNLPNYNNSRVVHGGLDPGVKNLTHNDPWSVLNMRNIDDGIPNANHDDGKHWTKSWRNHQENASQPVNVYYGHDAARGLDLDDLTFGTDSACVYGGKLSALEINTHQLTQVKCKKYSD